MNSFNVIFNIFWRGYQLSLPIFLCLSKPYETTILLYSVMLQLISLHTHTYILEFCQPYIERLTLSWLRCQIFIWYNVTLDFYKLILQEKENEDNESTVCEAFRFSQEEAYYSLKYYNPKQGEQINERSWILTIHLLESRNI